MSAEVDAIQQCVGSLTPFGPRQMTEARHHVADCRQMREEPVLLEDKANRPAMRWNERSCVCVGPRVGARSNCRVGRPVQAGNRSKNRRLAAARRSKDRENLSRVARELDVQRNWTLLSQRCEQGPISHEMN